MAFEPLRSVRTERVSLNALKLQRDDARATITRLADDHDVRIDSIEERAKRFSLDVDVTVTGDPDHIGAFCKAAGGIPAHESPSARLRRRVRTIVNAALDSAP